jgi:hypothetical protein
MPFTPLGIYDIALKADTLQNMYLLGGNINNNLSSLKATKHAALRRNSKDWLTRN